MEESFEFYERPSLSEDLDLLPILLKISTKSKTENEVDQMTPSNFMAEMQLSTEERIERLKKYPPKPPLQSEKLHNFHIVPEVVLFQNFKPGTVYSSALSIRNTDKIPRALKGKFGHSPYFSVFYASALTPAFIAPGMAMVFHIQFCGEELKDYRYKIVFTTSTETFEVPIIAVSPRPLLDFPDQILLDKAPVKVVAERIISVRNLGQVPGVFSINVNAPFVIKPSKGILEPERSMQLTVSFISNAIGAYEEHAIVSYQSGEKLFIKLSCKTKNSKITLEKDVVQFAPTFMGLTQQKTVKLCNKSQHIAKFRWKSYSCSRVDEEYLRRLKLSLNFMKEHESIKDNKVRTFDILKGDEHEKICERIYTDEVEELENADDNFLYQNNHFEIIPQVYSAPQKEVTGEVWPNGEITFTVIFSPTAVEAYKSTAYLEVQGLATRVPLQLGGDGRGPLMHLNLDMLNIHEIYMWSPHQYEVAVTNQGDIPGHITFVEHELDFGGNATCWPTGLYLRPAECGAFVLQYTSNQQGKFFEQIHFQVTESGEILRFVLMGIVMCPLLKFRDYELSFDQVPIGHPVSKSVVIFNPSDVAISFECTILGDGNTPAMTCKQFQQLSSKYGPYFDAKEFTIVPEKGSVPPHSAFSIELILTANIIREVLTRLIAKSWNADKYSVFLPIKYSACVPQIECMPPEVALPFCFVSHPYKRSIKLINRSHIPGYFCIRQIGKNESPDERGVINCKTSISESNIKPFEQVEINLEVRTMVIGESRTCLLIKLFGDEAFSVCKILCNGQGPVISVNPDVVDFDKVTLLELTSRKMVVTNTCPIAAFITTRISPKTQFVIEPRVIELQPDESATITISLFLCDRLRLQDTLEILVENGMNTDVVLKAKGVGGSILCEPTLGPYFNAGVLLTYQRFVFPVHLTNKSLYPHRIQWSRYEILKNKDVAPPSVFALNPDNFTLDPEETIEIAIEGYTVVPGQVQEDFYCHAFIGKVRKPELIMSFDIEATFVHPTMEISRTQLTFRKDIGAEQTNEYLAENITITNRSCIPIDMDVYLQSPFRMQLGPRNDLTLFAPITLQDEESTTITVTFDPLIQKQRCFVVYEQLTFDYHRHPHSDKIPLNGFVNFPSIEIIPNFVQFNCVPPKVIESQEVVVKNVSPLPVTYHFEWQEESIRVADVECCDVLIPLQNISSHFSKESGSDVSLFLDALEQRQLDAAKAEAEARALEELALQRAESKKEVPKTTDSKRPESKQETPPSQKGTPTAKKGRSQSSQLNQESQIDLEKKESHHELPVEYVYQKTYTETIPSFHYMLTEDLVLPSVHMMNALKLSRRNKEYFKDISAICANLLENVKQDYSSEIVKKLSNTKQKSNIHDILNITPAKGYLKPFECQRISIIFHPFLHTSFKAKSLCNVRGGSSEALNVHGMSSTLSYSIDQTMVDFGTRIFCQWCEKSITVVNTGYMEFDFITSAQEFPEFVTPDFLTEVGCLTVNPKQGVIPPQGSQELKVKYFPGIAGEFSESFTLEIGYLPAITITVHGYGVYPQAVLFLPRTEFSTILPSFHYLAVATLTPDYLKALKNIKNIPRYDTADLVDDDIPKKQKLALQKLGWVIVSYNDHFPTTMDIDMAAERLLLYQHIMEYPEILYQHTKVHKPSSIYNFVVPSYMATLGYVILNTVVHCVVVIFNYGPTYLDIKLASAASKRNSVQPGLTIEFKRSIIPAGESKELYVTFEPALEDYTELDYELSFPFYLEVAHGPRIPVVVTGLVTVPTIKTDSMLDFGEVICGNCMRKTLVLQNKGYVVSEWKAYLQKGKKRQADEAKAGQVFFLKCTKGTLPPEQESLLDVYFEPQVGGPVEWYLILSIYQNPSAKHISVKGTGLKPQIKITEELVEMGPVLPYAQKCTKNFVIENVSSFPIEIYFSDYDNEVDEEESTLNLLLEYYKMCKMYIPLRTAGEKLPMSFQDFREYFTNNLKDKLLKTELENLSKRNLSSPNTSLISVGSENRNRISHKKRALTSKLKFLPHQSAAHVDDPLASKTYTEIQKLLIEHIPDYKTQCMASPAICLEHKDPLTAVFDGVKLPEPVKDPTDQREGVFIILHGGPTTNIAGAANRAGIETKLPVYSLDTLFFRELVANKTASSEKVNELIHMAFSDVASETDLLSEDDTDQNDELQKKINLLLSGKQQRPATGKGSSKSSKSSKKEVSKKDSRPTFLGIAEDLFLDMLKCQISQFHTGVIIASLESTFLRQPLTALNILLKAIGNVQYLLCIILSYTFENNEDYENQMKDIQEKAAAERRSELLFQIAEMTAEEFDNLPPHEFQVFKELVLEQRKLDRVARKELIEKRKAEAKHKKLFGSKAAMVSQTTVGRKKSEPPGKSEKASDKSSKKKDSSKGSKKDDKQKISPEEREKQENFAQFESDLFVMLHTFEHWDRKTSTCTKPLPTKNGGKQSATRKESKNITSKKAESSKVSLLSPTAEVKPLSAEEERRYKQNGIPCWVFSNAGEDLPIESLLAHYLPRTPELEKAKKDLQESCNPKVVPFTEMYTALRKPAQRLKSTSDYFLLKDAEMFRRPLPSYTSLLSDDSQSVTVSKLSISSKKRRKVSEKRRFKSLETFSGGDATCLEYGQKSYPDDSQPFTSRTVLQPGEKLNYEVYFKPNICGSYTQVYTIELTGWPTRYYLTCSGYCDIPRIDMTPEKVFAKIVKKRTSRNTYQNCLFLKDLNVFDFGPVLYENVPDISSLAIETELNFVNVSSLPCELSFTVHHPSESYKFNQESIVVNARTTNYIKMSSVPSLKENPDNELIISIKDNPRVETIPITSEACRLELTIFPDTVQFNHILKNQPEVRRVVLANNSLLPINWELLNTEDVIDKFEVSSLRGHMSAKSSHEIIFAYGSKEPHATIAYTMDLEVYDKDYRSATPLLKKPIEISAEVIDVLVECPRELNLGEVKGKFEHSISYTMLNKGKYNVDYIFRDITEKDDPKYTDNQKIRNYFNIAPTNGTLPPTKPVIVKITFFSKKPVLFRGIPLCNVVFKDTSYRTPLETFILKASAETHLSNYELCPPEEINFGYQMVGSEKMQEIILTNNGHFDFSYSIQSLRKLLEVQSKTDKGKGNDQSDKSDTALVDKGGPRKKPKPTKLDAGPFSIVSSTGIVDPGETWSIQVFSRPKQVAAFDETLVFFITESAADKKGIHFNLSATACSPSVDFSDTDRIFREHFNVDTVAQYDCPKDISEHSVFIKDESRLHFSRVTINRPAKARIWFENKGPIPADIVARVSGPEQVFEVYPGKVSIDTYGAGCVVISFTPYAIDTFRGSLEVVCLNATGPGSRRDIALSGEALVPQVTLNKPVFDNAAGCFAIHFEPVFVGDVTKREISFENTGTVASQVLIEACEGMLEAFKLLPCEETTSMLKVQEKDVQNTAHHNLVCVNQGRVATFNIEFKPTSAGNFTCLVKLHIVNNPFEVFLITVTGEGYYEDVALKNLPTVKIPRDHEDAYFTNPAYEIEFGYCCVNTMQKRNFKITNHHDSAIYKFEVASQANFFCMPGVGHLKPKATKDIIATFYSKEPVSLEKVMLRCIISQIEYVYPQQAPLSWDERQNVVIWEPLLSLGSPSLASVASTQSIEETIYSTSMLDTAMKRISDKGEPVNSVILGTARCIPLLLSVTCDYSMYHCSHSEIEIEDTLVYEKNSCTFEVKNTAAVPLRLCWQIGMLEGFPQQIHVTSRVSSNKASDQSIFRSQSAEHLSSPHPKRCRRVHLQGTENFLPDHQSTPSTPRSSLFSAEDCQSASNQDVWNEGDPVPFTIVPQSASLQPAASETFKVTFAPRDVLSYAAQLSSPICNLCPAVQPLAVTVKAKSLLPLCHFHLDENDYLTARRIGTKVCQDIADENTKVVEFQAVGLRTDNIRGFDIINPTNEGYHYKWIPAAANSADLVFFDCLKPEGFVETNKTDEALFNFVPQTQGTFEAFYIFQLEEYEYTKAFLLVGHCREPKIYFNTSSIQLKPTVLGIDVKESVTLKNAEDFEVSFRFKRSSLYSEGRVHGLVVEPAAGSLAPHAERQIELVFHPTKDDEVVFNLRCVVDRMAKPLHLAVVAQCFTLEPLVYYELMGNKIVLDAEKVNVLDLKNMQPKVSKDIEFKISNMGVTGFYYTWNVKEDMISNRLSLAFTKEEGFINVKDEEVNILTVVPLTKVIVKKLKITLEIRYGPTYTIHLMGNAAEPLYAFSFNKYDFGLCFTQKDDSSYYTKVLEFANKDEHPITLECSMPEQDSFTIDFRSNIVQPRTSQQMLIVFNPREVRKYYVELEFLINSKLSICKLLGEGVMPIIELWDPHDKFIDLGSVQTGKSIVRVVKVLNKSEAPLDIIFNFQERLPYHNRPVKTLPAEFVEVQQTPQSDKFGAKNSDKTGEDKRGKAAEPPESVETAAEKEFRLLRAFVTFAPKKCQRIPAGRIGEFCIKYSPTKRMRIFAEKVWYQIQDNIAPLCTFKGSCIGSQFVLERSDINFGAVVQDCFSVQKVALHNTGDVGSAFKWIFDKSQTYFIVTPTEGFLSPGTSVTLSAKFEPPHQACIFKAKATCVIDGFRPLDLLLSGSCFNYPPPKAIIKFSCPVRQQDAKMVSVQNPTTQKWELKPSIRGQYFTAPELLVVEPRSSTSCDVKFRPLTMAKEIPHEAILFFPLPEGQGLLYSLVGVAAPPLTSGTIMKRIFCKMYHSETLLVKNWLKDSQKMKVITECANTKVTYKLTGLDTFDLLPQSEKEYTWTIYCLNEGELKMRVKFQNIATLEYMFYDISLSVGRCPTLEVISLTTCIRKPVYYKLKIQNPVKNPVSFTLTSNCSELTYPNVVPLEPYSEEQVDITYNPVTLGERVARFEVTSKELGVFPYEFSLTAHPPIPESSVTFNVGLGQATTQMAVVTNPANTQVTFTCEIQASDLFFACPVNAGPKQKVNFEIFFEPTNVGTFKSVMRLDSPLTGPYIFPLVGICTPPQPQGPFFICPGSSTSVPVKNPFLVPLTFSFAVEPAIFTLKSTSEEIKPRKEAKVAVSLLPLKNLQVLIDRKYALTGKLIAWCPEPEYSHIKWVYYLQGDLYE